MRKTVLVGIACLLLSGSVVLLSCCSCRDKDAKSGEQTKCPMCGRKIDKDVYVDHEGKRVYLCSEKCKAPFEADPEVLMKKLADGGVVLEDIPEDHSSHDH